MLPTLRIVTRCVELVVPSSRSPKLMLFGDTESCARGSAIERAVRGMLRVPPTALLTTARVPVKESTFGTEKSIARVHDSPGEMLSGQPLVSTKGAVTEMLLNDTTALPVLVMRTFCRTGSVPTVYVPKSMDDGSWMAASWMPSPVRNAVAVPAEATRRSRVTAAAEAAGSEKEGLLCAGSAGLPVKLGARTGPQA